MGPRGFEVLPFSARSIFSGRSRSPSGAGRFSFSPGPPAIPFHGSRLHPRRGRYRLTLFPTVRARPILGFAIGVLRVGLVVLRLPRLLPLRFAGRRLRVGRLPLMPLVGCRMGDASISLIRLVLLPVGRSLSLRGSGAARIARMLLRLSARVVVTGGRGRIVGVVALPACRILDVGIRR